ncbi:MAG: phenylalanine--tRNA ligase subunit beta [bacterium]
MKFSYNWIKSYFEEPIPEADKLADIITMYAFEVEGVEPRNDDFILDISVLPNRAHDCFSHSGIAREVSAVSGAKIKQLFSPREFEVSKKVKTIIKDATATPRISALSVENITVSESPEWMKKFLEAVGQKSINNIVDTTNFVMLHSGQPLHAYDRAKLTENPPTGGGFYTLSARPVGKGESLATLDSKEREIPEGAFVITDDNRDAPLSIAGIKGGAESKIDTDTKDIVVEAASFNPTLIRETSRLLKLRTDASDRFEKEISPTLCRTGLEEFATLILEICPNAVIEGMADAYPNPQQQVEILLPKDFASKKLGLDISPDKVKRILTSLEMQVSEEGDNYKVLPPLARLDLVVKEDLAEEIGRIYGYENVLTKPLAVSEVEPEINKIVYYTDKLRREQTEEGYSEVQTYSFVDSGEVELMNPLASDKNYLRASMLPKLKEAYELNKKNKDLLGLKEVRIFEIGKIFKKDREILALAKMPDNTEIDLDEYIASQPNPTTNYLLSNTTEPKQFKPFSQFPFITRDIALWVPSTTDPETIEKLIRDSAGELLVKLFMFDKFDKDRRTSYGFRLVFQSMDKTLTDDEANKAMEQVTKALSANKDYEIR